MKVQEHFCNIEQDIITPNNKIYDYEWIMYNMQ